jgi:hypothetical protein
MPPMTGPTGAITEGEAEPEGVAWVLNGELPCRDKWKALILALRSSGKRPLEECGTAAGRLALERTPRGVEDIDIE